MKPTKKRMKQIWEMVLRGFDRNPKGLCKILFYLHQTSKINLDEYDKAKEQLLLFENKECSRYWWEAPYYILCWPTKQSHLAYTERINALGFLIAMNS
jgi:hypothetical protein